MGYGKPSIDSMRSSAGFHYSAVISHWRIQVLQRNHETVMFRVWAGERLGRGGGEGWVG